MMGDRESRHTYVGLMPTKKKDKARYKNNLNEDKIFLINLWVNYIIN